MSVGLDFFITEIPREVFSYSEDGPTQFVEAHADVYPYLLVNIGSGVSMIKVSGKRQHKRVGGTSLGGGTLWGLLSLLTGANTFDEMLSMAEKGDNAAVDMLVGDIYGTDYGKIGLKSTTIASSMGKVFRMKRQGETHAEHYGMSDESRTNANHSSAAKRNFGPEDISRSLLLAVRLVFITISGRRTNSLQATTSGSSHISSQRGTSLKRYISEALSFVAIARL